MFSRQKGGFRHGFVNAVLVFFLIYRGSFGWNIGLFGLECFCVGKIFRIEYFGGFDRLGREKMLAVFLLAGCLRVWLSYEEVCYWYRGNMGFFFARIFFRTDFFSHGIIFFSHGMHGIHGDLLSAFIFFAHKLHKLTQKYFFYRTRIAQIWQIYFLCCLFLSKFLCRTHVMQKKHPWTWNSGVMFIWISSD